MDKPVTSSFKQEIFRLVNSFNNKELLEELFYDANGDDYDGGFTLRGAFKYKEIQRELLERLYMSDFISEGDKVRLLDNI